MFGDPNRSIQVLNISNVNAQGKTVLNDGKLLELIQKYPFLYNPRVKAYNDNDYRMWAWKNINGAFNRSYANDPTAAFSTQDLMNRWQILKPLIQCLSKAYDLEAIPISLRQSVITISSELENQNTVSLLKTNALQNCLRDHMADIAELPMEKKLALEKDVIDLILSSELEAKQNIKLDEVAWKDINQDAVNFLDDIGFKQVLELSANRDSKMSFNSQWKQYKPYGKNKWVKLKDAKYYIKPCHVRIQRINIDDYLPLAKIIDIKRKK